VSAAVPTPIGPRKARLPSTNRHNRIYDASELRLVIEAAGFTVEEATSRTYHQPRRWLRALLFETFWKRIDACMDLLRARHVERGDYLFGRTRKCEPVIERFPRVLYFDANEWPDWFSRIREEGAAAKS
jgi:hypothetical protein